MGLFRRDRGNLEERFRSIDKIVEDLATCCSNNADGLRTLQHEIEPLKVDMKLQWDKVNTAVGRMSKREATEGKREAETGGNGPLSADEINRRILEGEPL